MFGSRNRINRFAAAALAGAVLGLAAGCTVPAAEKDSVAVDTGMIGRVMPGAYFLLSWPAAENACLAKRQAAEIQDVKNGVATYRCVDRDAGH